MFRFLLITVVLAFGLTSASFADDWEWEDVTQIKLVKPNADQDDSEDAEQGDEDEQEPQSHNEDGEPLNFGSYFGNGDEFIDSNVAYDKERFITITDYAVDANGSRLDDLAYEDDGEPQEFDASTVEVETEMSERSDNVFGPLYGVPEDAVGMEDYDAEDYGGMEPGDEDVIEPEEAELDEDADGSAAFEEELSDESAEDGEQPAEDAEEAADEESADESAGTTEEAEEEGTEDEAGEGDEEKVVDHTRKHHPHTDLPEEWWNDFG